MKANKKDNKKCTIRVRCTEHEMEQLDRQASKYDMNRSEYARSKLFAGKKTDKRSIRFTVKAQEFLNYIENQYGKYKDKDEEAKRMVNELWNELS